ncbi:MAG: glycosyltransferase family 87 protein [Planctomycetota bacterium]|nr:glycosyltransferase family 87 protein [Planctomycetota bacterium]
MKLHPWITVPILIGVAAAAVYVPEMEEAKDFVAYREAASLLRGNGEIYQTGYIYPPTFAYLFGPFAVLSPRVSAVAWYGLNVALLTASVWMAARLAGLSGPWSLLPFVFIFRFANNTLRSGQANILILFLICLTGHLVHRRREVGAALSLALATVTKVTPGLLFLFFALQQRWRLTISGGLGLALLLALPAVTAGPKRVGDLLHQWQGYAAAPYLSLEAPTPFEEPDTGYIPGQSIRATVHRLLRPIDATPHDDAEIHINLVSLSRGTAEIVTLLITLALIGIFVWRLSGTRGRERFPLDYAIAILFILVISPYVRKGHGVILLIPYAVAVAAWKDPARSRRFRTGTGVGILVSFVLASLTGRFLLGVRAAGITSAYSLFLWGVVALLIWAMIAARQGGEGEEQAGSRLTLPADSRAP